MKTPPWIGPKICTPISLSESTYLKSMPTSSPAQEKASAIAIARNHVRTRALCCDRPLSEEVRVTGQRYRVAGDNRGMAFLLRVELPDVPGSLGVLATALGDAGADIEAIEIIEHRDDGMIVSGRSSSTSSTAMPSSR